MNILRPGPSSLTCITWQNNNNIAYRWLTCSHRGPSASTRSCPRGRSPARGLFDFEERPTGNRGEKIWHKLYSNVRVYPYTYIRSQWVLENPDALMSNFYYCCVRIIPARDASYRILYYYYYFYYNNIISVPARVCVYVQKTTLYLTRRVILLHIDHNNITDDSYLWNRWPYAAGACTRLARSPLDFYFYFFSVPFITALSGVPVFFFLLLSFLPSIMIGRFHTF